MVHFSEGLSNGPFQWGGCQIVHLSGGLSDGPS